MNIKLYYAPTTCALVPWVNLTEAGAESRASGGGKTRRTGLNKSGCRAKATRKNKCFVRELNFRGLPRESCDSSIQLFVRVA